MTQLQSTWLYIAKCATEKLAERQFQESPVVVQQITTRRITACLIVAPSIATTPIAAPTIAAPPIATTTIAARRITVCALTTLYLFLGCTIEMSIAASQTTDKNNTSNTQAGSQLQDWIIPELVAIPTNTSVIEESDLAKYEPRKAAASLIERKRQFDDRWADKKTESSTGSGAENSVSDSDQNGSSDAPKYELVSFFPEEFIDSLIKNGQLNGHELPQEIERQVNIDPYISNDLKISDEKERMQRLIDDGSFMQGRGQRQAAVEIYTKALDLAKKINPLVAADLSKRIDFFAEQAKDKSVATARAIGWEHRADLEFLHLGIKVGSIYHGGLNNYANSLLPKYGIVNFTSEVPLKVCRRELMHYGALIIVYRDEVRFRSSYSYGDSTIVTQDKATGLAQRRPVKALTQLDAASMPTDSVQFVETQVWGPITLADIKEFRIPSNRNDIIAPLAKSGLPIYSYNRDGLAADPAYVPAASLGIGRVSQISAGDEAMLAKYQAERLDFLKHK